MGISGVERSSEQTIGVYETEHSLYRSRYRRRALSRLPVESAHGRDPGFPLSSDTEGIDRTTRKFVD